jgi:hypothetical protein
VHAIGGGRSTERPIVRHLANPCVVSSSGRHSSWSLGSKLLTQSSQHSNIVVRINPRIPLGGNGSATVLLMNANGQVLSAANASFGGLAKGVKGPRPFAGSLRA